MSLVIYGTFIFTQTIGHRQYFLHGRAGSSRDTTPRTPSNGVTALSSMLLLVCLAAVVLLAKKLAPSLEAAVSSIGRARMRWSA